MADSDFNQLQFPNIASWQNNARLSTGRANKATAAANVLPAGRTGVPLPVRLPAAKVTKTSNGIQITLTHTISPSDQAFSHVDVWATGYLGNAQPVKVSSGTSPHTFLLSPTGEAVTLTVQSVGVDGSTLPLNQSPTVSVSLK